MADLIKSNKTAAQAYLTADSDVISGSVPLHGGDLIGASLRQSIPVSEWVDLSTGINPESYPIPDLPISAFQRLPYQSIAFKKAVADYYQSEDFFSVAGSQAAIQLLPNILSNQNAGHDGVEPVSVLLPEVGYSEHAKHWRLAKVEVETYPAFDLDETIKSVNTALDINNRRHLIVINPNNPTGLVIDQAQLVEWANKLAQGCFIIVDEAFVDADEISSALPQCHQLSNFIVLRSFGKFFGLAGLRLGFVFAHRSIIAAFEESLGPWSVPGVAQEVAISALNDTQWQQQAKLTIKHNQQLTLQLISPLINNMTILGRYEKSLFVSFKVSRQDAVKVALTLESFGVLIRVVNLSGDYALLRFGIISGKSQMHIKRLQQAIDGCLS